MTGIFCVQPRLTQHDYKSHSHLKTKLEQYIEAAIQDQKVKPKLIVFPELLPTWCFLFDEYSLIFKLPNHLLAFMMIILQHPISFFIHFIYSLFEGLFKRSFFDHFTRAFFLMVQEKMFSNAVKLFSEIAIKYKSFVVGGSFFSSRVKIDKNGCTLTGNGLYNNTLLFDPNGKAIFCVEKRFLTPVEGFIDAGTSKMKACETSLGRIGILVCADSWWPQSYDELQDENVDILVCVANCMPKEAWKDKWKQGYTSVEKLPVPKDVDRQHLSGSITEGDAWEKYTIPSRMKVLKSCKVGVCSMFVGSIWSISSSGVSVIVVREGDEVKICQKAKDCDTDCVLVQRIE